MTRCRDLLAKIRLTFPQPISDRIHDAYFSQLVHRALDRIDDLKSESPFLGRHGKVDYGTAQTKTIGEEMADIEQVIYEVTGYLEGIPIWGHPHTQENVVPPTSIPSIIGMMSAAIYNPDVSWDAYSHRVAEAEVEAVSMVSALVGYDPACAGGVFTFGGTGTNLYGVKVGLQKVLPNATQDGIRKDVKIICSDASHYSKLNVASWLGIGTKNIVTVPTDAENAMKVDAFGEILHRLIDENHRIAAIIVTMGTTDAFGIDPLKEIVATRDQIVEERGLDVVPHLHADAVIGWPWTVFNDYDFDANPLEFAPRTLRSLQDSLERIRYLNLADSIGVDFHKTGYAPYISSLFLVKDRADFELLHRTQAQMPYLYQFGEYHPGMFILECSRNGGSILAGLANLKLFGKQGYRVILGHVVEMAEWLRERLEANKSIVVLNDYNFGPVTLFRVYPPGVDAKEAYGKETMNKEFHKQLLRHNRFCHQILERLNYDVITGRGVSLSITDNYRETSYGAPIAALKSFIMSPFTNSAAVDLVVDHVQAVQRTLVD